MAMNAWVLKILLSVFVKHYEYGGIAFSGNFTLISEIVY